MYVIVNNFDYDALLAKLVQYHNLNDVPDLNQVIKKLFTGLSERFNANERKTMTDDQIELVERYFSLYPTVTYSDWSDGDASDVPYIEQFSQDFEESSIGLYEALTDSELELSDETKAFLEFFNQVIELDEDKEDAIDIQFNEFVDLVMKYHSTELNEGDIVLLREFDVALAENERLAKVDVIDKPGTQVQYGNTLITFPLILIKAISNV